MPEPVGGRSDRVSALSRLAFAYARHQALCLARNLMVFGYNPKQADLDAGYSDPDILFGTDSRNTDTRRVTRWI